MHDPVIVANRLRSRRIILTMAALIAVVLLILTFPYIKEVIIMLLLSLIITYFLHPGVVILERFGLDRQTAILLLFAIFGALVALLFVYIIPVFITEAIRLKENLMDIDVKANYLAIYEWLELKVPGLANMFGIQSDNYEDWISRGQTIASGLLQKTVDFFASAINIIVFIIVVPFLTFFMLRDGNRFTRLIIENVPNRFFEMTLSLLYRIDKKLENYIVSILIESVIVGFLTWVGLEILGVKFALVLGILHGLLNMIPYFGPAVAYIPIGFVVLLTYPQPTLGLFWMTLILFSVQMIDNWILKLVIIAKAVKIHPVVVILAVLIGGKLAGALGMFIAIPMYAVFQVIIVDFYSHLKKYQIV